MTQQKDFSFFLIFRVFLFIQGLIQCKCLSCSILCTGKVVRRVGWVPFPTPLPPTPPPPPPPLKAVMIIFIFYENKVYIQNNGSVLSTYVSSVPIRTHFRHFLKHVSSREKL
ncbi:hypothetical protein OUZ56_008922 [Daphnia magna]|uniref:Secreted protein n=1 Tax=Daphnia magna TaxID=35525 RepID=A0ABR0AEF8_9CRUS|nr:hypothetical protein OUZ56_008922 [Daphnia magna]